MRNNNSIFMIEIHSIILTVIGLIGIIFTFISLWYILNHDTTAKSISKNNINNNTEILSIDKDDYNITHDLSNIISDIPDAHNKEVPYIKYVSAIAERRNGHINIIEIIEAPDYVISVYENNNLDNEEKMTKIKNIHDEVEYLCKVMSSHISRNYNSVDSYIYSIMLVSPNNHKKIYTWVDENGLIHDDMYKEEMKLLQE